MNDSALLLPSPNDGIRFWAEASVEAGAVGSDDELVAGDGAIGSVFGSGFGDGR